MKHENEKQFVTSDFYLASFCLAKDLTLLTIDRTNPQRVLFVFQDTGSRKKLVEDFLYGRSEIEPKIFVTAIKEVKQLLHQ